LQCISEGLFIVCCSLLQSVAVCCSLLQSVAVCCSVQQRAYLECHCVAEYIKGPFQSVCQYVAVCCSMLQCVAVYIRGPIHQIGPSLHFGWFVAIFPQYIYFCILQCTSEGLFRVCANVLQYIAVCYSV